MKKNIFLIFSFLCIGVSFWGFFSFGTGVGFREYTKEGEYRRLHPEFLPSPIFIKAFDLGHSSSYASFTWLNLIQYIADNIGGNEFLTFNNSILTQITTLNPYFIKPYELGLILSPLSYGENIDPIKKIQNQKYSNNAILLGKKGMEVLCDKNKLELIKNRPNTDNLLNDSSVKNPCASGNLPYYIAFVMQQMGENKIEAAEYYKIASAQDDAPNASRMLGILALSATGDHMASALNFGLIGINGYDTDPFTCRRLNENLIKDISSKRVLNYGWINELEKNETNLKDTRDPKNPLSNSNDNCYEMYQRSVREIYLAYITNIAKGTSATVGEDLITLNLIKKIPTLSSQKNYTVYLKDGLWQYRLNIK